MFLVICAVLPLVNASLYATVASGPPADNGAALSQRYSDEANRILTAVRAGTDGYCKLEQLCDDIGNRLSGSVGLERAVEWAVAPFKRDGHENVRTDAVEVVKWVRGDESLEMVEPRHMKLAMLGLGGSVGTQPEGITASVISVSGQEELNTL